MVSFNGFSPLTSNFKSYARTSNYSRLTSPSFARYRADNYPTTFITNPYPNTLTMLPAPLPSAAELRAAVVDPATLPIVPDDLRERPKQPDSSGLHDLNPYNPFSYHTSKESLTSYRPPSSYPSLSNMVQHLGSPLFTDPQNRQFVLPDGQIGTDPIIYTGIEIDNVFDTKKNNDIIYEARKARGDTLVRDIAGRVYTPDAETSPTNDSQDFVDESILGQVDDFVRYNFLDPITNSPEKTQIATQLVDLVENDPNVNNFEGLGGDLFLSDIFQSNTALETPLDPFSAGRERNFSAGGLSYPFDSQYNSLPINNVLGGANPFSSQRKPKDNPLAGPFRRSDYNDYSGTLLGEYYHTLEYMQKSFGAITGRGINGQIPSPISAITGFDPLSNAYGWLNNSPTYQKYLDKHVWGEHAGRHDVFTPRGFALPSSLRGDGSLPFNNSFTPRPFIQPSFTNPALFSMGLF